MNEVLPDNVEQLLLDLKTDSFGARKRAVKQLGEVSSSNLQIVQALTAVECTDPSFVIRDVARESLRAPVHKEALKQYRPLLAKKMREDATVEEGLKLTGVMMMAAIFFGTIGAIVFFWIGAATSTKLGMEFNPVAVGIVGLIVGAIVGVVVVSSERDWRFMRVFEDLDISDTGRYDFGCVIGLALLVVLVLAETVWVIVLAMPKAITAPWQWAKIARQLIRNKKQ